MLEKVMSSIQQQAMTMLTQYQVDGTEMPKALGAAKNSMSDVIGDQLKGGKMDDVLSLFKGGGSNGTLIGSIVQQFAGEMGGLNGKDWSSIGQKALPGLVGLVGKHFNASGSNGIEGLLAFLGADKAQAGGGLEGLLSKAGGLGKLFSK